MKAALNKSIFRLAPLVAYSAISSAILLASPSQAREHLFGALDNETLLNCETLHWSGQSLEANACYMNIVRTVNPPEIQAEAMWALGDLYTADELLEQASTT